MLKSPIDNQGNIRLLEVLKLSLLAGIFSVLIGSFFEHNTVVLSSSLFLTGIIMYTLTTIKLIMITIMLIREIMEIYSTLKLLFKPVQLKINTTKIPYEIKESVFRFIPHKTNLELCIMRN